MDGEASYRLYRPDERPDIEVLVHGIWCRGELRAWERRHDGWWGNVQYRLEGEYSSHIDSFPADRIRLDTGAGPGAPSDRTGPDHTGPPGQPPGA